MGGLPENVVLAWPIVAVFVGDIAKRLGLKDWIIGINMGLGGLVAMWLSGNWSPMTFILGMELGAAGTGVHKLRQRVTNKEKA